MTRSPLARAWRRFAARPEAVAALALVLGAAMLAVLAPLVAAQDPYDLAVISIADATLPPGERGIDGTRYWLGTDDQGRDMLSAMLYGARISLFVGAASTALALVIGIGVGLTAAYRGGAVDAVAMRLVDIQLSTPAILVALVLLALLGKGVDKIILALVAVQWAYYARTARSAALSEKQRDYIAAARSLCVPTRRIVFLHLLPNCLAPILVVAAMQLAHAIALEATLSFLGLGLPITEPSLGLLIANGYAYLMGGKVWISFFPGLLLLLLIFCINIAADQLRDAFDPRWSR
jgi:peptide/nickel transport system permease protein